MKTLFLIVLTLLSSISPGNAAPSIEKKFLEIDPFDLKLAYESFDGTTNYPCKASFTYPENPYDFTVKCYNEGGKEMKSLSLHLAVTRYQRTFVPRTQYEILYWVNQEGATTWLKFDEIVHMQNFSTSQSVVGEAAGLSLKLKL